MNSILNYTLKYVIWVTIDTKICYVIRIKYVINQHIILVRIVNFKWNVIHLSINLIQKCIYYDLYLYCAICYDAIDVITITWH